MIGPAGQERPVRTAPTWPCARPGGLVTPSGEPLVLRGASLFWSQWGARFYNRRLVEWLARDWRVDVVRAAMAVDVDGGYLTDPARETAKIASIVEAAIDCDLYVIIDWHSHARLLPAAIDFFAEMARRYGSAPNVIFELWNEPGPDYDWARDIKPYHEAVLELIRTSAPRSLAILGAELYAQRVDKIIAAPVVDANVCYGLHFYAATHGATLRAQADQALAAGLPLFVSEWGACDHMGNGQLDLVETRRWWRWLKANRISDLNWSVFDKKEAASALRPGAASEGGWSRRDLTVSGRLVRARLRASAHRDGRPRPQEKARGT